MKKREINVYIICYLLITSIRVVTNMIDVNIIIVINLYYGSIDDFN